LELGVTGLTGNDYQQINISINGKNIVCESVIDPKDGWEHLRFDQSVNYHTDMKTVKKYGTLIKFNVIEADLVKGNNRIRVNFDQKIIRNQSVILEEVRLHISYN
jgi:hypothetical protein